MPLEVEITTPFGTAYREEAEMVVVPAFWGELGVLPGHTHYLAQLGSGVLRIKRDGTVHYFAANGGFCEITPTRVLVLCDTCEAAEQIDVERARAAMERARKRLEKPEPGTDIDRAKIALHKALLRLKVAGYVRKKV